VYSEPILGENAFAAWPPEALREFQTSADNDKIGQRVVFEDDQIRVWSIDLPPGERLPFHRHRRDYSWTCLTAGQGLTRYDTGEVFRVTYIRGDQAFYDHRSHGDFMHDLENIGSANLRFVTVEYLD
jgi:hypothetical protein